MTAPLVIGTADERQQEERQAIRAETTAMADAFDALQPLGEEARFRAIIWLARALDLPVPYRHGARRRTEDVPF